MAFLTGLLLIALLSLDWAKNCKAVNYEFKQFGVKKYGFGCKKGCYSNGTKVVGDHIEQDKCVECKTLTKAATDEESEKECNDLMTCFWNSKKKTCGAGACPYMAAIANCETWKNGKCEKKKDENCEVSYFSTESPNQKSYSVHECTTPYSYADDAICSNLSKYCYENQSGGYSSFTADNAKECKYKCDHPEKTTYWRTYEYTKDARKLCNKVYGCIYEGHQGYCSYLSVWAFVIILVVVILIVIAIIALIIFLIIKLCGSKTSQVNPDNSKDASQSAAANEEGVISDKAIHDQPVEGPYVVIKMGDKQLNTKKVAKAPVLVWGETVVFDTLGNEDEDATFELHGSDSDGAHTLRILDYVNNKQRVPLTLKNSAGADVGVLEVDIEIKAQEESGKVSGVYFIDKYGPSGLGKE